jgi:hypothetical protein
MWVYKDTRISISPTVDTANWQTFDLNAAGHVGSGSDQIPTTARAVMILMLHGGSSTLAGVRPTNCTTAVQNGILSTTLRIQIVPIIINSTAYNIDTFRYNSATAFYILAYANQDTGLQKPSGAFTNLFGGVQGSYQSADPSDLPEDGTFCLVHVYQGSGYQISLQKDDDHYINGKADPYYLTDKITTGFAYNYYTAPGTIQYKQSSTNADGFYCGYLPYSFPCNRTTLTLAANTTWTLVTATEAPAGSAFAIINAHSTTGQTLYLQPSSGTISGAPDTNAKILANGQLWWMIPLDSNKQFKAYCSDYANLTLDIIGYVMYTTYVTVDPLSIFFNLGGIEATQIDTSTLSNNSLFYFLLQRRTV